MAVSGSKLTDFSGSLSYGSAEDVDHFCDPCLTTEQQVDAHKYCVDCGEYLCRNCSSCHLKTKASRNHQLVDKDKVSKQYNKQDSAACTEKCPEHKQEVIKYFCPRHDTLGCHDCIIMCHRTCKVDYIPDKCADISISEEYKKTAHRLDLKLQELNEITKSTTERDQDIDKCHHNLLQEVIVYREEINDYLDRLQQKIQEEADTKKSEDKQITQRILDRSYRLSSDVKKMQSTLQANKTSGKYGQMYIAVKQAQSVLSSDEIKAEDGLEKTAQQYIFERNNSLMNMLSKQDAFGKLRLSTILKSTRRDWKTFHNLTEREDINVRTLSDKYDCWITGCSVLSSNTLVLVDGNNHKLKLLNINTKSVVEEISLDSKPLDVAVLSEDLIAITLPDKREIVVMACGDRLSTVSTVSVSGECRGITHLHGKFYVVCQDPLCVLILDMEGNVQNTVFLNKKFFSAPHYLVVSEDSMLLYISDLFKNCVVSITLQGEVTAVYKHKDLIGPRGMLKLDDGSLLVCYCNGSIHHISLDLKQGQNVVDDLRQPFSICYSHHLHEVYIGTICDLQTLLIP